IKSDVDTKDLLKKIRENASKTYSIKAIVDKYMDCIEEVINIPMLNTRFKETVKLGYLNNILDEVVTQSKVEFNYADEEDENAEE
ncbi:MAG: restriction endonuclease, partial [Bacteroidales bacterium]